MNLRRVALITSVLGFMVIFVTGCVVRRTVKDGDDVVAEGYVVKTPLISP